MSLAMLTAVPDTPPPPVPEAPDPSRAFRAVLGALPKGVAVITSEGVFGPCGMTVSAICSLSLEPPMLLVCLANRSHTLKVVRDAARFGVNVLSAEQEHVSQQFARQGTGPDKFDGVPFSHRDGVPILAEALAWMVCEATTFKRAGDHTIVIGSAQSMRCSDGDPLLWHRGRYRSVA